MVNTAGYQRIFDLEAERKNVQKALQVQLAENQGQQDVYERHSKVMNKEKSKLAEVQNKESTYRSQHAALTKEIK